ncbi:hypothetical protein KC963_00625 [Candidatus Saccharibacteria bacterium]|nr:hypothetical protein [Candidatus Saccharibacteria bacterium]
MRDQTVKYQVGIGNVSVTIPTPNNKYLDKFIKFNKKGTDILSTGVFPNAKEITESYAALNAFYKHFNLRYKEDDVLILVVGDGAQPRTGVTFAFNTPHIVVSIDPAMMKNDLYNAGRYWNATAQPLRNVNGGFIDVERLKLFPSTLWEWAFGLPKYGNNLDNHMGLMGTPKIIVVGVHDHAPPHDIDMLKEKCGHLIKGIIQMPCCFPNNWTDVWGKPDIEYEDWGIHSPHRTMNIWRF